MQNQMQILPDRNPTIGEVPFEYRGGRYLVVVYVLYGERVWRIEKRSGDGFYEKVHEENTSYTLALIASVAYKATCLALDNPK